MQLNYFANGGSIDRRGHQRVNVDLFSLFSTSNKLTPGQIRDLSLTGLRLESQMELALSTELEMLLKLDHQGGSRHMRVSGEVVREIPAACEGHQYGIVFKGLSPADFHTVDEYLYNRLAPVGEAS